MTGNETMPNGMTARDYIFGWDLNGGRGFDNFADAKATLDYDYIPYESLWKINGEVYKLRKVMNKPVFDFWQQN